MSLAIVIYLFLGGAGAGACLVLSCSGFAYLYACARGSGKRPFPPASGCGSAPHRVCAYPFAQPDGFSVLSFWGYLVASVLLLCGICCLLTDLGRTDRLALLVYRPTLSYVTVGAYSLIVCLALSFLLSLVWRGFAWRIPRAAALLGQGAMAIVSLVVAAYTGLLLQSLDAVPLWGSGWLPALFCLSALSCGIATVLLVACCLGLAGGQCAAAFGKGLHPSGSLSSLFRSFLIADLVVIFAEAAVTFAFIFLPLQGMDPTALAALGLDAASEAEGVSLSEADLAAAVAAANLVVGEGALWFWGGYVVLGLAAPIVLAAFARSGRVGWISVVPAYAISVLIGGLVMRYCIVEAGMIAGSLF